jgi:uncharacterized membrane protein
MRRIIQIAAVILSIVGLVDAIYLTVHHYTAEEVPCSFTGGCEMVLTSSYAEVAGIPLAAFGAAAYFTAFVLALLAVYGKSLTWKLYGALTLLMAAFSGWLIYVQAVYIHAFCQYCLFSAGTSITLFLIFLVSLVSRRVPETPNGSLP